MKDIVILIVTILVLSSCNSAEKLDREAALKIIKEQDIYPKLITEDIYIADPADARRLLEAGLEDEGLVTIQRTQKLSEVGERLILFTENAKPYLMPGNDNKIQQIKIAEQEIDRVTNVQMIEGEGRAVVEYTTTFKNISPFSKLFKMDLNEGNAHKVDFVLYDDGWRMEN